MKKNLITIMIAIFAILIYLPSSSFAAGDIHHNHEHDSDSLEGSTDENIELFI